MVYLFQQHATNVLALSIWTFVLSETEEVLEQMTV